jgi:ABC-type oligopeptide transport system ATPase subunit
MTRKAIITVGISGSGKSTFAKTLLSVEGLYKGATDYHVRLNEEGHLSEKWIEINRDNLRFDYKTPDWTKYRFTKRKENEVTRKQEEMFYRAEERNLNIVCSDTNLNPKTRNKWIELLESLDYEVDRIVRIP